jgi:hypothetical protein
MNITVSIRLLQKSYRLRSSDERDPFFQLSLPYYLNKDRTIWTVGISSVENVTIRTDDVEYPVSDRAGISFGLFARLVVSEYQRYEPIGGGFLPLKTLLEKKKAIVDVIDNSDSGSTKKFVRTVLEVRIKGFDGKVPLFFRGRRDHGKVLENIVDRYDTRFDKELKPTIERYGIMHIRCHYPHISGLKTPASTFALFFPPICDPLFLEHHVRIACDMNDWTLEELTTTLEEQFSSSTYEPLFSIACRIISEGLCLFANACDYVQDRSFESEVERFIDSFQCLAGDCDDLARVACYCCYVLYFYKEEDVVRKDSLFYWLVKWMKLYVPGMLGGIASCPSLTREGGAYEDREIYHLYCGLLPTEFFARATNRGYTPTYPWEKDAPLLILEGTNYCNALTAPIYVYLGKKIQNPTEVKRKEIEKIFKSFKDLSIHSQQEDYKSERAQDIPEEKFSHFYRRVLAFWTHDEQVIDWSVGYGRQEEGTPSNGYGVDFRDFVTKDEKITMVPSFVLQKDELDVIAESLERELPVRIDAIAQVKDMISPELSRSLTHRGEFVTKRVKDRPVFPRFISYRINHLSRLNKTILNELKECSKVYKMDYRIFSITGDGELYLIDIRLYI